MAITRVFRVRIKAGLREEFEEKFADISVREVQGAPGMESVSIHRPTKWSPDEYAMITVWTDEESLTLFAGENWNQPVIPNGMEKFVQESSVAHYGSWN
ncbi:MAG: antibiotic biosynthesis monooxygenase [Rhodospirillaceae bacterium]|nr:antibiotic biosynthesis monooxygenase [Rhodospirillaceae bacterium]